MAGANTAIWRDIYLANADALVAAIDDTVARLSDVRAALQTRDGGAVAAWNDGARDERRRLLEADLAGGEVHELRVVGAEPAGRGRRGRARSRARGRQHPRHGAVPGSRLLAPARSRSGSPGERDAAQAQELVEELGLTVARP